MSGVYIVIIIRKNSNEVPIWATGKIKLLRNHLDFLQFSKLCMNYQGFLLQISKFSAEFYDKT